MLRTALFGAWLMVFSAGCTPAADTDAAPPDTLTQQQDPAEKARGIDVSHDQGDVNWAEVRAAGMAFAFMKATEGETFVDPKFETNTDLSFWNALATDAFSTYPLWIAEYGVDQPKMPEGWTQWHFWQYSDSGQVNGVAGNVDLDVFNGTVEELKRTTE